MIKYKHIDTALLAEKDDGMLAESIYYHVDALLGDNYRFPPTNVDKIDGLPEAAKNIWFTWEFGAEVGGSWSIFDYLVNMVWPAKEIALTLDSLLNIDATELLERLTAGIPLSKVENAEFWSDEDTFGLENIEVNPKYRNFDSIDDGIGELIDNGLDRLMAEYIRKNSDAL